MTLIRRKRLLWVPKHQAFINGSKYVIQRVKCCHQSIVRYVKYPSLSSNNLNLIRRMRNYKEMESMGLFHRRSAWKYWILFFLCNSCTPKISEPVK